MRNALIKKTGEIFDVINQYSMFKIKYKWSKGKGLSKVSTKEKEDYYVLSNDETYKYDEVIVGIDEIREWKLKNIL